MYAATCTWRRSATIIVMHVFAILLVPISVRATTFDQYDKMGYEDEIKLVDSLTNEFRRKMEKEHPDRKDDIDTYFTEDPFMGLEFGYDLDVEIAAYREWAENTTSNLGDYTIEDVAAKVVARRFPAQLTGASDGTFVGIKGFGYFDDYKQLIIKNDKGQSEGFVIVNPDNSLNPYIHGAAGLMGRRVRVFWKCDEVSESTGVVKTVLRVE
jgi:hypothetical protein